MADFVSREQLQKWFQMLNSGETMNVKKEIKNILLTQKEKKVSEGLTFHEIEIGKVYRLRAMEGTKKYLHHVPVKIVDKKIKNVTGTLEKGAGRYKAGSRFTIPPEALEEVPS